MICPICGKQIADYSVGDFFPWQCLGHGDIGVRRGNPYYQPTLENVNENDIKAFIRKLLQAHDKAIVERLEKMKIPYNPHAHHHTQYINGGYNSAIEKAQNAIKEGNHE